MALAEGAGNDWLPLLMVDGHDYDEGHSSLVFALFAGCMGLGRLAGSPLIDRIGRSRAVRASGLLCIVGIGLVILADDPVVAAIAVALWGLGASLGFPLAVSAANDGEGDRQAHVAAIAKIGYLAFLVGPPALGLLGEAYGLRNAMLPVVALVIVAVFAAAATRDSAERLGAAERGDLTGTRQPD
jgi:fucose permease